MEVEAVNMKKFNQDKKRSKESFVNLFNTKGFYIILILSVVIIGGATILITRQSLNSISENENFLPDDFEDYLVDYENNLVENDLINNNLTENDLVENEGAEGETAIDEADDSASVVNNQLVGIQAGGDGEKETVKDDNLQISETGYITHTRLHDFYIGLKSAYIQPIAILADINNMNNFVESDGEQKTEDNIKKEYTAGEIPRKGGGNVEFYGTAVFNGDKMIGELTGEETRILNLILGEFKRGNFSIDDPHYTDKYVPIDIRMERNPKVKVEKKGDKVFIDVDIILEGDILAIQSHANYEEEPQKSILEEAVKKRFKDDMNSLIDKCKEWGVDILHLGKKVSSCFSTIQEWEDFNWISKFKESEINVEIDFVIRRTGTLLKSSPIITIEGKK
jgi:hypothetical protein